SGERLVEQRTKDRVQDVGFIPRSSLLAVLANFEVAFFDISDRAHPKAVPYGNLLPNLPATVFSKVAMGAGAFEPAVEAVRIREDGGEIAFVGIDSTLIVEVPGGRLLSTEKTDRLAYGPHGTAFALTTPRGVQVRRSSSADAERVDVDV